jgi:hypothetical protein
LVRLEAISLPWLPAVGLEPGQVEAASVVVAAASVVAAAASVVAAAASVVAVVAAASRYVLCLPCLKLATYHSSQGQGRQWRRRSELPVPTHEQYQYQENICGQLSTGSTASTPASL